MSRFIYCEACSYENKSMGKFSSFARHELMTMSSEQTICYMKGLYSTQLTFYIKY